MTKQKRILITGVRGFVGRYLLRYLQQAGDFHITGASRDKKNLAAIEGRFDRICSYDELLMGDHEYDTYVHLAGKVIHDQYNLEEEEYFQVNFEQTRRIYDQYLKDPRAARFVFLSTIHVLTEKPDRVIDETYEPRPFTPYGKSKFEAENYIQDHAVDGKGFYILRPSMIHGPGNKGNLNMLYELLKRGYPYPLGSVNNQRTFVSIDNLCFIIHELLVNKIESGLYHVADDEPTYTHDLIRMIAEMSGKKPKMISMPVGLIRAMAKLGNVIPIPINEHRLLKLTENFIVSNEKIKNAIGKELPVRAEDGLRKTLRSFKG